MNTRMLELLSLRKGTTLTKEMFLNHLYGGMDEPEPAHARGLARLDQRNHSAGYFPHHNDAQRRSPKTPVQRVRPCHCRPLNEVPLPQPLPPGTLPRG